MNKEFLDEYIHLEKLCNDIYGANHGISVYIEDMEATSNVTQNKIPMWENTYKKLKELRWKRNQYVHEGSVEFNREDAEWLAEFYKNIISGEDPLSKKRTLEIEAARSRNLSMGHAMNNNLPETVQENPSNFKMGWIVVAAIVIVIICILMIGLALGMRF